MTVKRKHKPGDGATSGSADGGPISKRAKLSAIHLVRKALGSRLESKLIADIVNGLEARFDISTNGPTDGVRDDPGSCSSSADGHDESCYSCGLGGELLCCDTCSTVFHLHCLWPKLSAIPKGRWSCPFCVAQGKAKGDPAAAEQAVKKINLISRGIITSASARSDAVVSHLDDGVITVQKSAGRCYYLHEALEAAHALSNGQRYQFSTALSNEMHANASQEALPRVGNVKVSLICTYCMDSKAILRCAFCGCRECFEKGNVKSMLVCDECGHRWHYRCYRDTPSSRRASSAWYCPNCTEFHPETAAATPSCDAAAEATERTGGGDLINSSSKKKSKKKKKFSFNESTLRTDNVISFVESAESWLLPKQDVQPEPSLSLNVDDEVVKKQRLEYYEEEFNFDASSPDELINVTVICGKLWQLRRTTLSRTDRAIISSFRTWASRSELQKVACYLKSIKRSIECAESVAEENSVGIAHALAPSHSIETTRCPPQILSDIDCYNSANDATAINLPDPFNPGSILTAPLFEDLPELDQEF